MPAQQPAGDGPLSEQFAEKISRRSQGQHIAQERRRTFDGSGAGTPQLPGHQLGSGQSKPMTAFEKKFKRFLSKQPGGRGNLALRIKQLAQKQGRRGKRAPDRRPGFPNHPGGGDGLRP